MRLLTQNFLACLKCESYPLRVTATELTEVSVERSDDFTRRMLARVDYGYLLQGYQDLRAAAATAAAVEGQEGDSEASEAAASAAAICAHAKDLPATVEDVDLSDDSEDLKRIHYAINELAVRNGALTCESCGVKYNIREFIPNFVLDK